MATAIAGQFVHVLTGWHRRVMPFVNAREDSAVPAVALASSKRDDFSCLPSPRATTDDTMCDFYNERLARLNKLSWMLNALRDPDAIMRLTLQEAPALVGASSSTIWLWDADQQAPNLQVTLTAIPTTGTPPASPLPPAIGAEARQLAHPTIEDLSASLLQYLRQACENCCAFSIDAHAGEENWPDPLRDCPIAFIPLPAQEGCLGILTVHQHATGQFSHDDILLLSSLANQAATALRNVQLHSKERALVSLLQKSIRQVVEATTNRGTPHDEFMHSLLQLAEGLTRADALCAGLRVEGSDAALEALSGPHAARYHDALLALARTICPRLPDEALPLTGSLHDLGHAPAFAELPPYYTIARIKLAGKFAGVVVAVSALPFTEDQVAFLCTIAEQIGVGVDNRQQSASLQRLLIQVANVNDVSQTIASTFDPQRIFATISQAANRALNAPVVFCGWREEDGSIRVLSDTPVGIPPEMAAHLRLTDNNAVIRTVLESGGVVSSRSIQTRSAAFPALRALHLRDWVCVPMQVKPRTRGIMLVADTRPRVFTPREVAIISTYANQGALAMENTLLYDQVDRQLRQMEQLYQVTRSVSASLDLDAVLQELLQAAQAAFEAPVAWISLADGAGSPQRVAKFTGLDAAHLALLHQACSEGIIGMVAQRGGSIISSNLARDGRSPALRQLARAERLVSSVTVALQVQGRVLGTLTIVAREAREFTSAHEQLLIAMATASAVAVQNAWRYGQEREHARALRALVDEVTARVTIVLEMVDELLAIAAATEPGPEGIMRTRLRVMSIAAVQAGIAEDAPGRVDVLDAVIDLLTKRCLCCAGSAVCADINVTGVHLALPARLAVALVLLVREWLHAMLSASLNDPQQRITVSVQQFGREILLQIADNARRRGSQAEINHAIMKLVTRFIPGTITEVIEGDLHQVRFRFNLATLDQGLS